MIDIYLKTTTRAALVEELIEAGLMIDEAPAQGVSLDEIGEIEGIDGYHANLRITFDLTDEQKDALAPIEIAAPATPIRVWA
jgi:hypothetical protein